MTQGGSARNAGHALAASRRALFGPALTVLVCLVIHYAHSTRFAVPSPAVPWLLLVVFSASLGGLASGLASASIVSGFALIEYSTPDAVLGAHGGIVRWASILVGAPLIAVLVGGLARQRERQAGEMATHRVQLDYGELLEELDAIVWEGEPVSSTFTFVSRGAEKLLGYPVGKWLEPHFWTRHLHPEDRERAIAKSTQALAGTSQVTLEYRMVAADGREVWLRDGRTVVFSSRGRPLRAFGVMTDITERKCAEESLRDSEQRYRLAMEQASDAILICDLDGNFVQANTRAVEIFGHTREELLRRNVRDLIPDEELRRKPLQLDELKRGGEVLVEREMLRRDGTRVAIEINARRLDAGHIHGIYRDVTSRKVAEEGRRHALSLLNATLDSTTDGILVVDRQGRITSHNRKFRELWKIPDEVLASGDDDEALAFVLDQLKDPGSFIGRVRDLYGQPEAESFDVLEFKDGRIVERYSMPHRLGTASIGRVWSFRDVTERQRAADALRQREAELRQAQKMEAIGRLAGGVAHDFNNLLTAILGSSNLMLMQLPPGDPLRVHAEEIEKASERAAALTHQLLAFSRRQVIELKVLDLNQALDEVSKMLQRLIGEQVRLEIKAAPDLGRVKADRGQLEQVIMNLVVNARDAMPEGGVVLLETSNVELDAGQVHETLAAGPYVMMAVSDTGVGMSPEVQSRIFEPFFTTKDRARGTGLGLSTVYGIVRQFEGAIFVYSQQGVGSTFKIYLPRVDAPVSPPTPVRPPIRALTGSETVLLVEDESAVRALARDTLVRHGYHVMEARDGDDALRLTGSHRGPLDLLVTDVVMPNLGGPELKRRLEATHPGLRVLYLSGYTDDAILRHGVLDAGAAFLQKPFTLDALARKVREVLGAPVTA